MITLLSWYSVWTVARYDPGTGRLRRRLAFPSRRAPCAGFFALERTRGGASLPVVLFCHDSHLLLRVGARRWRLPDPDLTFADAEVPGARFHDSHVYRAGALDFACTYRYRRASAGPTYSVWDDDEPFLEYVAAVGADPSWQASLTERGSF